jgi:hypothetical protein
MRLTTFARALAAALTAATVLSGCAKQTVTGSVGAPVVVSNQGSELAQTRTMAVASGAKLKLQFAAAINPDCSTMAPVVVRAVRQPSRGVLAIRPDHDFIYFIPANPRSACNTKRLPGTMVEYQAAPGFKGTDTLAYDVFHTNGSVAHHTVTVNVQ